MQKRVYKPKKNNERKSRSKHAFAMQEDTAQMNFFNTASDMPERKEARSKPRKVRKRYIALTATVVVFALGIPLIFATAANTNEVAKTEEIKLQVTASASPAPSDDAIQNEVLPETTDGQLTSELTDQAVVSEPTPTPTPAPAATPEPAYTVLSSGMTAEFVKIVQQRLMELDYMEPDDPTTLYGPITTQAIEYFQRKNGLPVDGIAGVQTQQLLFSDEAKYYTVSEGTEGPDVESIQERLSKLGYPATVDGSFGPTTTKAVRYFQRMNGLTDDGNVGNDTREALYSKNAEPSLEYTQSKKDSASNSDNSGSGGESGSVQSIPGDAEAFVQSALSLLGKKYVWGGKGPNVFDCSGFVYYALKISGNGIDYMTSAGWHNSGYQKIGSMQDLKRGDVIDYRGHVGIYLGDGKMVDASSSEGKVRITGSIFESNYWTSHFLEGRRVFN